MHLRNRMAIFREQTGTRYGTQLTMITTFGVLPNKHYSVVDSEVPHRQEKENVSNRCFLAKLRTSKCMLRL
ncbi:MAG: hypothetical protein ACI4C3_09625 [Bacteroides sp.]